MAISSEAVPAEAFSDEGAPAEAFSDEAAAASRGTHRADAIPLHHRADAIPLHHGRHPPPSWARIGAGQEQSLHGLLGACAHVRQHEVETATSRGERSDDVSRRYCGSHLTEPADPGRDSLAGVRGVGG